MTDIERFTFDLDQVKRTYREHFYAVVPQVFAEEEINTYRREAERLWSSLPKVVPENLRVGLREDANGDIVLDRLDPVEDVSEVFAELNQDQRLEAIAEELLGEAVMVMKEKLIFKKPGVSGFGLHRDAPYFEISGVPGDRIISIAVALDATTKENGLIQLVPSLHSKEVKAADAEGRDIDTSELQDQEIIATSLQAGDIIVYDALMPHQSDRNNSDGSRRTYTVTYAPRKYENCRQEYYQQRYQQQEAERKGKITGPFFLE